MQITSSPYRQGSLIADIDQDNDNLEKPTIVYVPLGPVREMNGSSFCFGSGKDIAADSLTKFLDKTASWETLVSTSRV